MEEFTKIQNGKSKRKTKQCQKEKAKLQQIASNDQGQSESYLVSNCSYKRVNN